MTYDQVLDTLRSYKGVICRIKAIEEEQDALTKSDVKTDEIEGVLDQEIHLLLQERLEIERLIRLAKTPRQKNVLMLRYIHGWSVERMCIELEKDASTLFHLQKRAIESIAERT